MPPLLKPLHSQMNNTASVCFQHASNALRHPRNACASRIETTLHEKICPLFQLQRRLHYCVIRPPHLAVPHHPLPDVALEKKDDSRIIAVPVCGMILSRAVVRLTSFPYRSAPVAKKEASIARGPSLSRVHRSPKRGAEARRCLRLRTTAPPPAPDEPTGPSHGL